MEALIQIRRGTAAQWVSANPILADGEPGLETDTGKGKYGAGGAHWATLPYSWQLLNTGPSGPAGGALTGTYPNPTLAANSVGASQITDGTVGSAELAAGAVTTTKIGANQVGAGQLADGAVTLAKMAGNSVDSSKIVDGSIGIGDLAPGVLSSVAVDVSDEGTLIQADTTGINFTGVGVTATAASGVVTVNVPGGTPGTTIPAGTIMDWTNATPPSGWYLCDGSVHADLAGTLGLAYGPTGGTVPLLGPYPVDQSVTTASQVASSLSGWGIDNAYIEVHAGVVSLRIQAHRTGATISLANPSHTDQGMFTIKPTWQSILTLGGTCYNTPRQFYISNSTGQGSLTSGLQGWNDADINRDDIFQMYVSYSVDMTKYTGARTWKIIKAP